MKSVLSPDLVAQFPKLELKTKPLRKHTETWVHPYLRWIKEEVEVIDQLEFTEVLVTQMGRSWSIPLTMLNEETEDNDE